MKLYKIITPEGSVKYINLQQICSVIPMKGRFYGIEIGEQGYDELFLLIKLANNQDIAVHCDSSSGKELQNLLNIEDAQSGAKENEEAHDRIWNRKPRRTY